MNKNEDNIVSHMNNEHQSVNLYINKFLSEQLSTMKEREIEIVGVDPDGFDLRKIKFY